MHVDDDLEDHRRRKKWKVIRSRALATCAITFLVTFASMQCVADLARKPTPIYVVILVLAELAVLLLSFLVWLTAAILSSRAKYSLASLLIVYLYVAICIGCIVSEAARIFGVVGILGLAVLLAIQRYVSSQSQNGGAKK